MTKEISARLGLETDLEKTISCIKCVGKTSHEVLAVIDVRGNDGDQDYSMSWHSGHEIIKCLGCKSISYRVVSSNSEDYYHDENDEIIYVETENLYPPRIGVFVCLTD